MAAERLNRAAELARGLARRPQTVRRRGVADSKRHRGLREDCVARAGREPVKLVDDETGGTRHAHAAPWICAIEKMGHGPPPTALIKLRRVALRTTQRRPERSFKTQNQLLRHVCVAQKKKSPGFGTRAGITEGFGRPPLSMASAYVDSLRLPR